MGDCWRIGLLNPFLKLLGLRGELSNILKKFHRMVCHALSSLRSGLCKLRNGGRHAMKPILGVKVKLAQCGVVDKLSHVAIDEGNLNSLMVSL